MEEKKKSLKNVRKQKKTSVKTGDYPAWTDAALHLIGTDIKCVGNRWFVYVTDEGWYEEVEKDRFAPIADSVQTRPMPSKTDAILRRIQQTRQILFKEFRSAISWDVEGKIVLLNVKNGLLRINLETGERTLNIEDRQKYKFLGRMNVNYILSSTSEWFNKTLEECLPSQLNRDVVMSFAGYTLLPSCSLEQVLINIGKGACGKSTVWLNGIANVFGRELVGSLTLHQICDSRFVHAIEKLPLNIGSELNATEVENADNFKRQASMEPIVANPKYRQPYEFVSSCKLCFLTNSSPRFKEGSSAELRRTRFVYWSHEFGEDKEIGRKRLLEKEADGIFLTMLDWLVKVAKMNKLPEGDEDSQAVHHEFATRNDFVERFVNNRCMRGSVELCELRSNVHLAMMSMAEQVGFQINDVHFARTFRQKFPQEGRWTDMHGRRRNEKGTLKYYYVGIALKEEFKDVIHGKNGDSNEEWNRTKKGVL